MQSFIPSAVLFLISPVLSLTIALPRIIESLNSRNILWIFCCFYGMAFYIDDRAGVDAVRYRDFLIEMHEGNMTWERFTQSFYREGENNYDIYQPLLTFIVSRFTEDYRVLFGIYGFVVGYFYSRVLGFFIDRLIYRPKALEYLLLITLALIMNIGNAINGVRMYTALYIFLFGALYYWETKRTVYLLISVSSIFVHFSYIIPISILLVLPIIQNLSLFVYVFFMGSFVFTAIQLEFLQEVVKSLPLGIDWRVRGYLMGLNPNEEMPLILRGVVWLLRMFRILAVTHLFLIWYQKDSQKMILLVFCMSLVGLVNLLSEVGTIGRFMTVADIILIGLILIDANESYDRPDKRVAGALVAGLTFLNTMLAVRFVLGFSSINLVIGNPMTIWFFDQPDRSLYDYLPRVLSGL